MPAASELIKIKERSGSSVCLFLADTDARCQIYQRRPLECRVLRCWDTREIEAVYRRGRLTREMLLSGVSGLWDLVCDHESRCAYDRIRRLLEEGSDAGWQELGELVRYDRHVRRMAADKGGLDPGCWIFCSDDPWPKRCRP